MRYDITRRKNTPSQKESGFPGGSDGKESACNAGDSGSGTSLGEGNGNPLQYSCLENPMDRGATEGCSSWGREEKDTTEQLTGSLSERILETLHLIRENPVSCISARG